eukprot:scaffold1977_cov269-Prasinococcus_capsulatus_cf.AAC.1
MDALGVRPPDALTRVTEYVPQVVAFVERLVARGLAYEARGSVYFDTAAFAAAGHEYRKNVPARGPAAGAGAGAPSSAPSSTAQQAQLAEGEGALGVGLGAFAGEKRCPQDFALWKCSKRGEPAWPSPWGPGRPGWHIECSVMASDLLGSNLDIHGGGSDLKFPHHDNELAQSEGFHDTHQWCNYFLHAGRLDIKGLKMSKSLKNFITIRQALREHTPRQIRLIFLLQAWDKPMNYTDQAVADAKAKEQHFKNFFGAVKALLRTDWPAAPQSWRDQEKRAQARLLELQALVHRSLLDNFDTPSAMQALVEM